MNTLEGTETKNISHVLKTFRPIFASADGNSGTLPDKIELLRVGIWDTPYHGIFAVTQDDLLQYKANFEAGVAQVYNPVSGKYDGITIDYGHEDGIAGGWITGLEVDGDVMLGLTTWSEQGKKDLLGGNYKYISPEFYPASRGGWEDPESYGNYTPNVLAAAGLVNRPLFKGLKPIMASAKSVNKEMIYISASAKENSMPTLEEVLAKNKDDLTEADKTLLTENKDKLTDEQKTTFGFEAGTTTAPADTSTAAPAANTNTNPEEGKETVAENLTPAEAAVVAGMRKGENVVVAKSRLDSLESTAKSYETEKAAAVVASHVERGAIKPDAAEKWTNRLTAAGTDSAERKALEADLKDLPSQPVLAGRIGTTDQAKEVTDVHEELKKKTMEKVEASAKDGKPTITYGQAQDALLREDKDLAGRVEAARAK